MPKYTVNMPGLNPGHVEVQQQLADGRWTPISGVAEVDTDAGYVVVLGEPGAGGQPMQHRMQGNFRLISTETGAINPAVDAPAAPPLPLTEPTAPAPRVVEMVDGLHQTAEQGADGTWSSTFAELAEVVGTGSTEAEARAAARAQALDLGHLVASAPAS